MFPVEFDFIPKAPFLKSWTVPPVFPSLTFGTPTCATGIEQYFTYWNQMVSGLLVRVVPKIAVTAMHVFSLCTNSLETNFLWYYNTCKADIMV